MKSYRRVFHIIPLCIFLVVSLFHPVFAQAQRGPLLLMINNGDSSVEQDMRAIGDNIRTKIGVPYKVWHTMRDNELKREALSLQGFDPLVILGHSHGAYDAYKLASRVPNLLVVTLDPRSSAGKADPNFPKPSGSRYWIHVYLKRNNPFWNDWARDRHKADINLHLGMRHYDVIEMESYVHKYIINAFRTGTCCQ